MLYFVTLFDKNYASRGLTMYDSLENILGDSFILYILGMDFETEEWIKNSGSKNIKLITIDDMKNHFGVLGKIEKERTHREFCWTLSSFSLQYVFDVYNVPMCIYVDSDIYFYHTPQMLLDEMKDCSVLITEHNYSTQYDLTSVSGKYCVQFMVFVNNDDGRKVLAYWKDKCEEACYECNKDGLFGDQIYLNDWESRFDGIVYNCRRIGCGVAPWNLQKYNVLVQEDEFFIQDKVTKVIDPLFFFHFHGLNKLDDTHWALGIYRIQQEFKDLLYVPYIKRLLSFERKDNVFINSNKCFSMMQIIRFSPVPFIGDSQLMVTCNKEDKEGIYCFTFSSKKEWNEELRIIVQIERYQGTWIRIIDMNNCNFFSAHLHEVLWTLQRELCYTECRNDYYRFMNEIFNRVLARERIMTECNLHFLGEQRINHPHYVIKNIVRVFIDNDSCNNISEYEDILNPDEMILTL